MRIEWISLVAGILMLIFHAPLAREHLDFQYRVFGKRFHDDEWLRPTEIFVIVIGIVFVLASVAMLAGVVEARRDSPGGMIVTESRGRTDAGMVEPV